MLSIPKMSILSTELALGFSFRSSAKCSTRRCCRSAAISARRLSVTTKHRTRFWLYMAAATILANALPASAIVQTVATEAAVDEATGLAASAPEALAAATIIPGAEENLPHGELAQPVRRYRSEVERVWFETEGGTAARGARTKVVAMSMGMEDVDSAARALVAKGGTPDEALANTKLAARLAPNLPIARAGLARELWRHASYGEAAKQAVAGVGAIFRNFEAAAWLFGSLLVMIAVVLTVAPLVFIVSVAVSVYARASHDLGDLFTKAMPSFSRAALLGALLLIPLALGEGIIGLMLALFGLAFLYGDARNRIALSLAVVLFVVGLYPVAYTASTALLALDSDAVAAATLAVVQGVESERDIALLEEASETEFLAEHILAVRERRQGHVETAIERYAALIESHPRNAEVLTNYANLLFSNGDDKDAVEYYERSAALIDSPRLMFNLSQANARLFKIEEFEAALRSAQAIDTDAVAELSRVGEADFVADLAFPLTTLGTRLLTTARANRMSNVAIDGLMPGWLGASWMNLAGSFALIAIGAIMLRGRFDSASSCARCGKRICGRCDGTVWNSETCNPCYHLFHRPETTDATLRMTRLSELQKRDSRLGHVMTIASLLVPGAAGLFARRPDLAFTGILFCGFAAVFLGWHDGVVPDPLAVGNAGALAFITAGSLSAIAYLVVVGRGLMIRRSL